MENNVDKGGMYMDGNGLMQAVQLVGFPITMCGALFWYMIKQDEKHDKEVDTLRTAIENNTNILTKLYERMSAHE